MRALARGWERWRPDGVARLIKAGGDNPQSGVISAGQQRRHFARVLARQEELLTRRVPESVEAFRHLFDMRLQPWR